MKKVKVFEKDVERFVCGKVKYLLVPCADIKEDEAVLLDSGEAQYIVTASDVAVVSKFSTIQCSILTVSDFEVVR